MRVKVSTPRWIGRHAANFPLHPLQGIADLRPDVIRKAVAAALQVSLETVPEIATWTPDGVGLGIDVQTTNALEVIEAGTDIRMRGQRVQPGDYQGFLDVGIDQTPNGRTVKWGEILSAYDKTAHLVHQQKKGKAPQDMLVTPGMVRIECNYASWELRQALGGERTLGYLVRPEVADFLFSKQVSRMVLPEGGHGTETVAQFNERCVDVLQQAQTDCELHDRKLGRAKLTPERAHRLYEVATLPKMPAEKMCAWLGVSSAELSRCRKDVHELGLDGTAATEPFSREVGPHLQPWTTVPTVPAPRPGETVGQGLIGRMREAA